MFFVSEVRMANINHQSGDLLQSSKQVGGRPGLHYVVVSPAV